MQGGQGLPVGGGAVGLPEHGCVGLQAQSRQIPQLILAQVPAAAGAIHVLHAHDPAPARPPRGQPRGQGRAQVAQVEHAGGRRGGAAEGHPSW